MVDAKITVEIVYARAGEQTLEQLRVPAAATVPVAKTRYLSGFVNGLAAP